MLALFAAIAATLRTFASAARDAVRFRAALVAENALLRHQLAVLVRQVPRPRLAPHERITLAILARLTPAWQGVLRLVRPDTLLRWHRAGFRALWRWKSRAGHPPSRLSDETVALIRAMAADNPLWGAERIRGELLKLGIKTSKRTIQKYMRTARPREPRGQRWSTFLKNQAQRVWACDFLQTYDIFFRPLFVLVFIHHATRRIVHAATTRCPSHAWVAQQLRNATPFGEAPRFLLRDRDGKFGEVFDAVAKATGIRIIKCAARAPDMNAICERFLGSLRRECLDHVIVCSERHLHRVVREYVGYHNEARPHQGIAQKTPVPSERPTEGNVVAFPVLGGLHHEYRRAA